MDWGIEKVHPAAVFSSSTKKGGAPGTRSLVRFKERPRFAKRDTIFESGTRGRSKPFCESYRMSIAR
jgi:hypothetical protein